MDASVRATPKASGGSISIRPPSTAASDGATPKRPGASVPSRTRGFAFLLLAGVVALVGCAHVEAPPGGPPDETPPSVVTTRPAADAIVPGYDGNVVFVFDERISEQRVTESVLVSPRTSPVDIRHGRQEIRVALRRGWQPGIIYHVTLRPTISDLFGNALGEPVTLVFSTGPPIPETQASGTVRDRLTGAAEVGARVEAIRMTDSLVYAFPTDSAGRFRADRIPEGDYLIRAYTDLNDNRELDAFEARDSAMATVSVAEAVTVELSLLMPDSTPPVITSVALREGWIEVEFDDHLDPEQTISVDQVTVVGPDGAAVPVTAVVVGGATGATDGALAPVAPAPAGMPAPPTPAPPTPAPATPAPAAGALPSRVLGLEIDEEVELEPGEYSVAVTGVRNVNGLVGEGEGTLTVEPPPEP